MREGGEASQQQARADEEDERQATSATTSAARMLPMARCSPTRRGLPRGAIRGGELRTLQRRQRVRSTTPVRSERARAKNATGQATPMRWARGRAAAVAPVSVRRRRPTRRAEPGGAAERGQDHTLDDQLPRDPPAACAERDANGDLLLPADGARQQQVGDIGAGDQEHEEHGADSIRSAGRTFCTS